MHIEIAYKIEGGAREIATVAAKVLGSLLNMTIVECNE